MDKVGAGISTRGNFLLTLTKGNQPAIRTLFFDFLPIELGTIRGFRMRFHLYTVPGQVFYDASRKLILKGVDGVVFVAGSQEARMDGMGEYLSQLQGEPKDQG